MSALTYAVVTPARDEALPLPRLARALARQTVPPTTWVIVDNGSADATLEVARDLAAAEPRIEVCSAAGTGAPVRGAPVVRAFREGLRLLVQSPPDVVVKLDADVTFSEDYFERLLAAFAADPELGIASGSCWEQTDGVWRQRFGTGSGVWGACRAYRWACLQDVSPLEERQGWDEIDALRANVRGWRTGTILELPFRHHREEGARDASRFAVWRAQGDAAHYMGYRPSYLLVRTLYRMVAEPSAIGVAWGFVRSALRRAPRCTDAAIRAYVRSEQSVARLPRRIREARRPREALQQVPEGS
jgi:glycosyltransferase involved in cell wall biosynthesis